MEGRNTKNKPKEVTTINELAVLINTGFQNTQDFILKRLDEKIDTLDKKFEDKIDAMDQKFEGKFNEVNYRLDKIDSKLDGQEKVIFGHETRIDNLEVDVKKLKKAVVL